jgi:hypothetical protein
MATHLCIGGPYAGRNVNTHSDMFKVCEPRSIMMGDPAQTIKSIEYRRQIFQYGDGTQVIVWAPSTQTIKQTMELLLETYERSNK